MSLKKRHLFGKDKTRIFRKLNIFAAYLAGLLATIAVMHVYKHAQPALLYLVPACLGVPLFLALVRGDIKTMFAYEDHPDLENADKKSK